MPSRNKQLITLYLSSNETFFLRYHYNYCNKINVMPLILWQPCRDFLTSIPTLGVFEMFLSSSLHLMNFWEYLHNYSDKYWLAHNLYN